MKTGIELIAEERKEQIEKHGWNAEHDAKHDCDELVNAAAFALEPNLFHAERIEWYGFIAKINKKNDIERLKVAGALIAAEIDRLLGA